MMRSIWKFDLEITDAQIVEMPVGAVLRFVAAQGPHEVKLWAEVDTTAWKTRRLIAMFGTGHQIPETLNNPQDGTATPITYVGSVIDGPFVWHVYDGGEI